MNDILASVPIEDRCPRNQPDGAHAFKRGAFADSPVRCRYCGAKQQAASDSAPTSPTARGRLHELLWQVMPGADDAESKQRASDLVDAFRAEIRTRVEHELLGDEANPSKLVLNAISYRLLVERIEATMTNPDQWDGDDAEVEILARYVEWLAAGSPTEDGWPVRPEAGESRG